MRNEKIINSPIFLFTGAGASKPLGKWLMGEFIVHLIPVLSSDNIRQLLGTLATHRKTDLEEILKELNDIIEKEYFADNKLNYITECLEDGDVLKKAKSPKLPPPAKSLVGHYLRFPHRYKTLIDMCKALRNEIEQLIFDHYWDIKDDQIFKVYSPLLETLKDYLKEDNTLPIFTTNYDVSIEKYATVTDVSFTDGFELMASGAKIWNKKIFDQFLPQPNKLNIVLFKLHGSISWYEEGGYIKSLDVAIHRPTGAREKNVLIYPAKTKIALDEPFFTCYDYFQRCLDHARIAIFIGYSFRDYDTVTKIKSALAYNPALKIFIFNGIAEKLIKENFVSLEDRFLPLNYKFGENPEKYLKKIDYVIKKALGLLPRVTTSLSTSKKKTRQRNK